MIQLEVCLPRLSPFSVIYMSFSINSCHFCRSSFVISRAGQKTVDRPQPVRSEWPVDARVGLNGLNGLSGLADLVLCGLVRTVSDCRNPTTVTQFKPYILHIFYSICLVPSYKKLIHHYSLRHTMLTANTLSFLITTTPH